MLFSPHEPRNVPERFVALIPKVCTRAPAKTFWTRNVASRAALAGFVSASSLLGSE
jgi:hypothetical protein